MSSILNGYYTEDGLIAELSAKGVKRGKRALRSWRQRREGPPWTRIGKTILYPDDGFLAWLKSQTQQPARSRNTAHK